MVVRVSRNENRIVLYVLMGVIALLGLIVVAIALWPDNRGSGGLEEVAQASEAETTPEEVDPWRNRENHAIRAAKRHRNADGDRLEALIESSEVRDLPVFQSGDTDEFEWTARWVPDRSLYWVSYGVEHFGVFVGAKWLVQMDPEGQRPEGSDGVIAANALAEFVEYPANRPLMRRLLGRSDRVLSELTGIDVAEGVSLSSALIVYFLGREFSADETLALGWTISPTQIGSDGSALYDAWFQWREDGEPRSAQWELDLEKGSILARNLLAAEIMDQAALIDTSDVVDIRPRSLDLSTSPSRERNSVVRALRYVLANEQRVEAVGTLLAARQSSAEIGYEGWRIEPDRCTECTVTYRYTEDGADQTVSWRVDARGAIEAVDETAALAERSLRLMDAQALAAAAHVEPAEEDATEEGTEEGQDSDSADE